MIAWARFWEVELITGKVAPFPHVFKVMAKHKCEDNNNNSSNRSEKNGTKKGWKVSITPSEDVRE